MNLSFHCNLDAAKPDVNRLNAHAGHKLSIPRIGESIIFPFQKNGQTFSFDLKVIDVTYNYFNQTIVVVLDLPPIHKSIASWEPWFKAFRYGN